MASKKISQLTPVTPILTDLVPLDRPTTGAGAPVTGQATLADIQALIGGGGGGDSYWEEAGLDNIRTSGSIQVTGTISQGLNSQAVGTYSAALGIGTLTLGTAAQAFGSSSFAINNFSQAHGRAAFALDKFSNINDVPAPDGGLSANEVQVDDASLFTIGDEVVYIYTASQNSNMVHRTSVQGILGNVITLDSYEPIDGYGSATWGLHQSGSTLFNLSSVSSPDNPSLAHGSYVLAAGWNAHAEGRKAAAIGNHSHAEGARTLASGDASHAEGVGTTASGYSSHAEGEGTIASGDYSHAEGRYTTASGYGSHAEGAETQTGRLGFYFNTGATDGVDLNNWVFELEPQYSDITGGNFPLRIGSDLIVNDSGPKRYLLVGINYDGTNNHVTASDAYGMGGYPVGAGELAGFDFDSGVGFEDAPMGGEAAHSEGAKDFQSGDVTGYAYGNYSHSEGYGTIAFNNYSHSEGSYTAALGAAAHSEGANTQAVGNSSHAEGDGTISSGSWSHAEGFQAIALGNNSHAEGAFTTGSGIASHAEGGYSWAIGDVSHAEGLFTEAYGTGSHSGGYRTIASGTAQTVVGYYNLRNNDFSLFVIGDGTADDDASRSDILRVNSGSLPGEGRVEITGSLSVSGSASSLEIFGGHRLYPNIITALPHTASFTDYIIAVSASAGPGVELRPFEYGRTFIVKDVSGSAATDNITVTAEGGELIDGASSYILSINRGSATFVYFGPTTGWGVI